MIGDLDVWGYEFELSKDACGIDSDMNFFISCYRDVWQMYLDKNEFELAKDYCRVGFDLDRSENYKFNFHTSEKCKPCIHICQKTIAALTVIFKNDKIHTNVKKNIDMHVFIWIRKINFCQKVWCSWVNFSITSNIFSPQDNAAQLDRVLTKQAEYLFEKGQ